MSDWDELTEEPDTGRCDICGRIREDHRDREWIGTPSPIGGMLRGNHDETVCERIREFLTFCNCPSFEGKGMGECPKCNRWVNWCGTGQIGGVLTIRWASRNREDFIRY